MSPACEGLRAPAASSGALRIKDSRPNLKTVRPLTDHD